MFCDLDMVVLLHDIREGNLAMSGFLPKQVRGSNKLQPFHARVIAYRDSFIPATVGWWNGLPNNILNIKDREEFKVEISSYFTKN